MEKRLSLSPVTIGSADFVEGCEIAHEAGYAGVAIRYDQLEKFLAEGHTIVEARGILESLELRPSEMGFLAEWEFYGGIPLVSKRSRAAEVVDESVLLSRLQKFFQDCAELGVRHVTAAATHDKSGSLDEAAGDFARLCSLARQYGLQIGLEFFGNAKAFPTFSEAAQIVRASGAPNGGILLDTFFFHMSGSTPDDIRLIRDLGVSLNTVQIADAAPGNPSALDILWDRCLPGEGVASLALILAEVEAAGYSQWYTIEVFERPMPRSEALKIARTARTNALALLEATPVKGLGSGVKFSTHA